MRSVHTHTHKCPHRWRRQPQPNEHIVCNNVVITIIFNSYRNIPFVGCRFFFIFCAERRFLSTAIGVRRSRHSYEQTNEFIFIFVGSTNLIPSMNAAIFGSRGKMEGFFFFFRLSPFQIENDCVHFWEGANDKWHIELVASRVLTADNNAK